MRHPARIDVSTLNYAKSQNHFKAHRFPALDTVKNILTLKGERKLDEEVKEERYYRKERCSGKFERAFTLPDAIDPEKITANFKDGVLKIEIPKPEAKKPRQIKINVN